MNDDFEIFVVYRAVPHNVLTDNEIAVGVIWNTYEVADDLIKKMNDLEEKVSGLRPFRRGWGQDQITLKNFKKWVSQ